jgi:hypothetical protein
MPHRWRIPSDRRWPVRPDDVLAALDEAAVPRPDVVSRAEQAQYPKDDDRVLQVHWSETDALGVPLSDGRRQFVSVVIHHVPSEQSAEIGRVMIDDALPDLVGWLEDAASAAEGWRATGPHGRVWRWRDRRLVIDDL